MELEKSQILELHAGALETAKTNHNGSYAGHNSLPHMRQWLIKSTYKCRRIGRQTNL